MIKKHILETSANILTALIKNFNKYKKILPKSKEEETLKPLINSKCNFFTITQRLKDLQQNVLLQQIKNMVVPLHLNVKQAF